MSSRAVLDLFLPEVGAWFRHAFGEPTRPQALAWPHVAAGASTLVVAPTGSGKTLAAFLWAIDRLYRRARERRLDDRVYLVYVSPLRALNNDIEKNLRAPLAGIREAAAAAGRPLPELRVAVRTGDTLQPARQAMTRRPPHVLITTPESLYLLCTAARFRPALASVETIIVDEVHALAASKRGAHLALTLERLEALGGGRLQRIGCSATVHPTETAARFLVGAGRDCQVVDAGFDRALDLQVVAPVPDLLGAVSDTIWDAALTELAGWIGEHRTTLIFTPSRRMAERLARNLNERLPAGQVAAHHGSLSRRARLDAEDRLKRGELRALVCTSSLELGIDVGAIDLVVQLQSPRTISAVLQRVGRSGHALDRTSRGRILVTRGDELLEAAAVVRAIRQRTLDRLQPPEAPLDVLAQQVVAAVAAEPWTVDDLWTLVRRAAPYAELEREALVAVVRALAEPLPAEVKGMAPRILWDRVNDRLHARRGSRLLALTSGGTIPDAGLFDVYVADTDVKLGTLDEEFVSESLPGDVFLLGSHPWRILKTQADRVLVEDAAGMSPTVPFWKGEHPSRTWDLGRLCGRLRREALERIDGPGWQDWAGRECGLEARAAAALRGWLAKARDVLGLLPDDGRIVVESLPDELGGRHLALHSTFGMRVNGAWGLALRETLRRRFGLVVEASHTDDAILLSFAPGQSPPPPERLARLVTPEDAEALVVRALIGSPLFTTRFRHAAVRALHIARMARGRRTPAWLQRLKADALLEAVGGRPDFPLVAETLRECCRDALDVPRLVRLLERLEDGELALHVAHAALPSPFVYPLLLAWDWAYLDAGHAEERRSDAIAMGKGLPAPRGPLDPALVATLEAELSRTVPAARARDANELAALLETLGDLDDAEVAARVSGDAPAFLAALAAEGRVRRIRFAGGREAWVGADEAGLWAELDGSGLAAVLRRCLRHRGPVTVAWLEARYGLPAARLAPALERLIEEGLVARGRFLPGAPGEEYVHRAVLEELQRRAAAARRPTRPVASAEEYAAFLLRWQRLHPEHRLGGPDGLLRVIERLQGQDLPIRFWEQEVLPARLERYDPGELDALGLSGQLLWTPLEPAAAGRVALVLREDLGWLRPVPPADTDLEPVAKNVLRHLELAGAAFVQDLARATGLAGPELSRVLWELFRLGLCAPDSFEPIRRGPPAGPAVPPPGPRGLPPAPRRPSPGRGRRGRLAPAGRASPLGRWAALPREASGLSPDELAERRAWLLLERHGILTRDLAGGEWPGLRPALTRLEYAAEVERGYFVEGLAGEQYALAEALAELGARPRRREPCVRLSLADPASLWPAVLPLVRPDGSRVPAPRLPQHSVVVRAGRPLLLAESHGRALTPLAGLEPALLPEVLRALVEPWDRPPAQRPVRRLEVREWDGAPVRRAPAAGALLEAGFYADGDRLAFDGFAGPGARR
jgi:ATP-dependent Lhr-like helicase